MCVCVLLYLSPRFFFSLSRTNFQAFYSLRTVWAFLTFTLWPASMKNFHPVECLFVRLNDSFKHWKKRAETKQRLLFTVLFSACGKANRNRNGEKPTAKKKLIILLLLAMVEISQAFFSACQWTSIAKRERASNRAIERARKRERQRKRKFLEYWRLNPSSP